MTEPVDTPPAARSIDAVLAEARGRIDRLGLLTERCDARPADAAAG